MRKGSPSNSLPKTFSIKFSPYRALHKMWKPVIYWERPVWAKFSYKVFGKGVRGDSPQCGEMSRSDRGARLRQRRTFPQKGFSPIITHKLLYEHRPYGKPFFISHRSPDRTGRRSNGLLHRWEQDTRRRIYSRQQGAPQPLCLRLPLPSGSSPRRLRSS